MSGLAATFETMHAALRGAARPDDAARRLGTESARLGFYADTVKGHVRDVLEKNYATLIDLLGDARFEALLNDFYERFPARAYELNENAAPFRDLLAEACAQGRHGLTAFHLELAEVEWQEFAAYVSTEVMPSPSTVSGPVLNPTLIILQLDYPVATFLEAWRGRDPSGPALEPPREPSPETVFVFRDPATDSVLVLQADDALLFAFKIAHDGLTPDEAAHQADLDPTLVQRLLSEAAEWGVILLPNAAVAVSQSQSPRAQEVQS